MMGWNHPANATPDPATTDSAAPDPAKSDTAKSDPATPELLPGEPDVQGMALTPLMNAVLQNSKDEVARLIAAGADVNATGIFHYHQGVTPLMIAAYLWNDEIAKLLIEAGADPNAMSGPNLYPKWSTDLQNETALYFAEKASEYFGSIGGNPALTEPSVLPLVKRLIAAGAAPSVKTRMGETPLMLAASNLHLQVADALIKAGANVNSEDLGHATPLIHAARASDKPGFEKMVELLLFAGAKRTVVSHGETPLLAALSHQGAVPDPSEAVKLLLSIGITPNQASPNGTTPLMLAAGTGYLESVKALLDAGADAMRASNNGDTPLSFLAVSRRDAESVPIAKLLIDAGVNVNAQDNEGDYALLIAALLEKKDLVQFLLASGANPQLQNQYGLSAEQIMKKHCGESYRKEADSPSADEEQLFYAAFSGNADQIRALVKKGVPLDSKTRTGEQLRIYPNRSIELTSDQLGHCTRKDHTLSDSSKWNNVVVYPSYGNSRDGYTTWALERAAQNVKVNYYDYVFGYTPFMMAAEQHRSNAVQAIIDLLGTQTKSKDEYYGRLSKLLLLAISAGYEDSAELLIKAGAAVNPTDRTQSTPLMAALAGEQWKIARRLIAAGAQVEVTRESLDGPFHGPKEWTEHRESMLLLAINKLTSSRNGVSKETQELIKDIIAAGADVNVKDHWENTPLTLAARYTLTEVARILLSAGADPNLKDSYGKTALELVGINRNQNQDDDHPADPEELKALLREAGAKSGAQVQEAPRDTKEHVSPDVKMPNRNDDTPQIKKKRRVIH